MKRAAARTACLVLVGAVTLTTVSIAGATTTAPEGCAWQRHAKQVVKRVKRHGHVRRVKRLRHWWSCDSQPTTPGAPVITPALPQAPAPPAAEAVPVEESNPGGPVSHLSVKAAEWSYTLSRPEVGSGEAIVELNNQGEDNHNLKLQRDGSSEPPLPVPEAAPGEQTTARVNLPAGTYRLYCSLFEHDEKGMHATLLVGAAGS